MVWLVTLGGEVAGILERRRVSGRLCVRLAGGPVKDERAMIPEWG